jgi:hypothetical protein
VYDIYAFVTKAAWLRVSLTRIMTFCQELTVASHSSSSRFIRIHQNGSEDHAGGNVLDCMSMRLSFSMTD